MNKLNGNDTIPYGVYSGLKLGNVVKMYGRKVLLEILKCNDVDDVYLKKYHYHHSATEEEKKNWELKKRQMEMAQVEICQFSPDEEVFETTATLIQDEEILDQRYMETNTRDSVLYDPEDDSEEAKCSHPSRRDWESGEDRESCLYDMYFIGITNRKVLI